MAADMSGTEAMRFQFGENWRRFLNVLTDAQIERAKASLSVLPVEGGFAGKRLLDAGSGSGLFSLAARQLGAQVHSFDLDPASVACAAELRRRYFPNDTQWAVESGSVLDRGYLGRLGAFDIVYSWGVLHHTGAMWQALENVAAPVKPGGWLVVALYNDQGRASRMWSRVKQAYNRLPPPLRWLVLLPAFLRLWGPTFARDLLKGRPFASWRNYAQDRGMSPWHNAVDWVGGWPFEVAKPEQVLDFCRTRGFTLERMTTCGGGLGCNEFAFRKTGTAGA